MSPRTAFVGLAVTTIGLGLFVHLGGAMLGPRVRDVVGDALWAMMLAWWVGALVPGWPLRSRALLALVGCFAVELSQLIHSATLDLIRSTTLGRLVLGTGYDSRDLIAYSAGVLLAMGIERGWTLKRR